MKPSENELHLQLQTRLIEELGAKQREFETLTELLSDVVFRCDNEGKFIFLNNSWSDLTGWSREETTGSSLTAFIASNEQKREIQSGISAGDQLNAEIEIFCKSREVRIFLLNARKRGGSWYGSLHDVTEQRTVIHALKKSEENARKLSLVASKTDNIVIISDAEGKVEWVNESFEKITGFQLDEIKGMSPSKILQGELTDPETIEIMREGLDKGLGFAVEIINYSKDGTPYWVEIDCSPVVDESDNIVNFIAIEREITQRKDAEVELKNSEFKLKNILNSVSESIFRSDIDFNLNFTNSAFQLATATCSEQLEVTNLREFIHPEDLIQLEQTRTAALASSCQEKCEIRMRNSRHDWRHVQLTVSVHDSDNGRGKILTGGIVDIHQRWQQTQALMQAKENAEELTRARTRFVANMSHEIRTPLNAIVGMASVLEATTLDQKQRTCVETLSNGGKALLALVNDVLDLSKLDSGKIELENSAFRIVAICEEAVDLVASQIEEKALILRMSIENEMPQKVIGDANRIRQVLINLLTNAVKFTEKGGIDVSLGWQSLPNKLGQLSLSVTDTGIGIAENKIDRLFDSFTQADATITRRFGGTGLGLAISKQICNAMNGEIEVSSEPGNGARFVMTIPLEVAENSDTGNGECIRTTNLNADLQAAINSIAHFKGVSVEHATESDNIAKIELVGEDNQIVGSIGGEIGDSVITPIRIWRKLSTSRVIMRQDEARSDDKPESNLRILVAEDVAANQLVVKMMLSQLGFKHITIVENGKLAVDEINSRAYDIAIFDIHMPVLDGLSAAREIRQNPDIDQPVIIAASADVTTDARQAAISIGIDKWLPKPFNRTSLDEVMRFVRSKLESTAKLAS